MKEKLTGAISAVAWVAAIILFGYWLIDLKSVNISGSPSGWWWFGCTLVGTFTAELNS